MAALTADRSTDQKSGSGNGTAFDHLVTTAVRVFQGGMVAIDTAAGTLRPAAVSATLRTLGVCGANVLGDGTGKALVLRGVWKFTNNSTDACVPGDIGGDCFVVDDQTVARVNTGGRPRAGRICAIETDGVWVEF